jgi:hypothetical protein
MTGAEQKLPDSLIMSHRFMSFSVSSEPALSRLTVWMTVAGVSIVVYILVCSYPLFSNMKMFWNVPALQILWSWGLAWLHTPLLAAVHQSVKSLEFEVLNWQLTPSKWLCHSSPEWYLLPACGLIESWSWFWWVPPIELEPSSWLCTVLSEKPSNGIPLGPFPCSGGPPAMQAPPSHVKPVSPRHWLVKRKVRSLQAIMATPVLWPVIPYGTWSPLSCCRLTGCPAPWWILLWSMWQASKVIAHIATEAASSAPPLSQGESPQTLSRSTCGHFCDPSALLWWC